MQARDLYASGKLDEAIAAMNAEVKSHPLDAERRGFLCELLCIAGNWERADVQLEAIAKQSAEAAVGVAMYRQLVRAAQWREQYYAEGRVPELLAKPDATTRALMKLALLVREGDLAEAGQLVQALEDGRPRPTGTCNGERFEDLRDLDDLTAGVLEVYTPNGKYYWVPFSEVQSLEPHAPVRPRDLLWMRATLEVRDGPTGEVFLPTIYASTAAGADAQTRLGRSTDWIGAEGEPVRGVGLRTLILGEEPKTILELGPLTFDPPAA